MRAEGALDESHQPGGTRLLLAMYDVLNTVSGQLVIAFSGLLMVITLGVYVVLKFRDSSDSTESSAELLAKFREMRHEGHIDEDEYRTIRTDLEGKLSQQSTGNTADLDGFDLQG